MEMNLSNRKKYSMLAVTMLFSLLWLGYQVILFNSSGQFLTVSRRVIEFFGISSMNKDTEWKRFVSVLIYLHTLPHVLLGYCLLVKWRGNGKLAVRLTLIGSAFAISLLVIPRVASYLFPSFRTIFSSNNESYFLLPIIHGIIGLCGTLAVWVITVLRCKKKECFQRRNMGRAVARYGTVAFIAFLTAVAYGFILGILNHFDQNAVRYVVRSFSPDSNLYSGIITMLIMAPLVEELVFRGVIFTKTKKYSNVWIAVIFSSVVFGLWHRNFGQFCATTVMGCVYAWIYQRTGKLRYAMVVHCLSNFFIGVALAREDSYLPKLTILTQMKNSLLDVSLLGGILGLFAIILLIVVIIWKVFPLIKVKETQLQG